MAKIQRAKSEWQRFKTDAAGKRFQDFYERRQRQQGRGFDLRFLLGGIAVTVLGLFLMPAPGPGALVVAFGLALLASQFAPMAKILDATEVRVRVAWQATRGVWQRAGLAQHAALISIALIALALGVILVLRILNSFR